MAECYRIQKESHHRVSCLVEKICHIGKIESEISCLFEKMEGMCHVEEFLEHDIEFSHQVMEYFKEEHHEVRVEEH